MGKPNKYGRCSSVLYVETGNIGLITFEKEVHEEKKGQIHR
jgi:hypothetical protein